MLCYDMIVILSDVGLQNNSGIMVEQNLKYFHNNESVNMSGILISP